MSLTKRPSRDPFDWITLWTAIVGVVIVFGYTSISAYQAYLGRKTMLYAIGQQRAWLRTDVAPADGFLVLPSRAFTEIKFSATNVGTVPATFVNGEARLIPMPTPDSGGGGPGAPRTYFDICKKDHPGLFGQSVFPGQTVSFLYTAPEADGNEIKKMVYRGRGVGFLLLTCVSYQTGADQNIHRTVQSYWVIDGSRRLDGMIFNPAGAVVRMTDLRFDPIQLVNKAD